jgi:DNA repair protein RecO (recombination protein O)
VYARVTLQPAYILHARAYRDTSLLIDFLTLDHGLLRAVARGARGPRSSKRALLQPLQPLLISLSGRGDLLTLVDAEHSAPAFQLIADRLFSAMYINELLVRLLQAEEAHPVIYRRYQQLLLSLQQGVPLQPVLRRFEWHLLDELGYAPDLEHDSSNGEKLRHNGYYYFNPLQGLQQIATADAADPDNVFYGEELIAMSAFLQNEDDEVIDQPFFRAAKKLMRLALRPQLGSKPLSSRSLFATKSGRLPPGDNKG